MSTLVLTLFKFTDPIYFDPWWKRPLVQFCKAVLTLSSWSSVDLELLHRSSVKLVPPFYELSALRWLVSELRDSPIMLPHIQNVLETIPLHLVMPAVLDQWFFLPNREWTVSDVRAALNLDPTEDGIERHLTPAKKMFLQEDRAAGIFNLLLHWTHMAKNLHKTKYVCNRNRPMHFPGSFCRADANWESKHFPCGRPTNLWGIFTEIVQKPGVSKDFQETLMEDLGPYIIASSPDYALGVTTTTTTSPFVESAPGIEFLSRIHDILLKRDEREVGLRPPTEIKWLEAMDILRRVHHLPEDYFKPFPEYFPLQLPRLAKVLEDSSHTDLEIDFGFLDCFSKHWDNACLRIKCELVDVLTKYINGHPRTNPEISICPTELAAFPAMPPAALDLLAFVNDRLLESPSLCKELWGPSRQWREAIERVKKAHPELPVDFLKTFADPHALCCRSKHGHMATIHARDSSGLGDARDTEEPRQSADASDPSIAKPSSPVLSGTLVNGTSTVVGEDTLAPLPLAKDSVTSDSSDGLGKIRVGGPNADKNV
ncbi:hypothetical protein AAF712_009442 [Marasmius tenuissimus]|uniref:Uncharacterized protein n=1 Tax=Marasmius tenuissimus TaxID=585030 RepID=A0ABR2ZRK6_9AGAR